MTALLPPHVDLREKQTLRCPLAIRFVDTALNTIVMSGLQVTARPLRNGQRDFEAKPNRSGTWLFYGLPGLRNYEMGGVEPASLSPHEMQRFCVTVRDKENRFLPCTFEATAPNENVFAWSIASMSPPAWGESVPLFSTPARSTPSGCAVVRAQLAFLRSDPSPVRGIGPEPAAWALMQASVTVRNGASRQVDALGLADEKGSVAVIFPWPEVFGLTSGSPLGGLKVANQGWEVTFRAWHDLQPRSRNSSDPLDLNILEQLAGPSNVLQTMASPFDEISEAKLQFGRELVIPEAPPGHRTLLLSSALSPL